MPIHRFAAWTLCLALLGASSACKIRDDSTRSNQIEGLRVLAMASSPADLVLGDTAVISALVFDEEERDVQYQWSWCISRGSEEEGYGCNITEDQVQAAWALLDTGIDLPSYDLGTEETASFEMLFEPEQALGICEIVSRDAADQQLALFTCIANLGLSFELRVTAGTDEIVAFREVPLAAEGGQRNQNPVIGAGLDRTLRGGGPIASNAPFQLEGIYDVVADIDQEQSETFVPEARDGLPAPEPRGESLFLSWFVTVGSTHRKGDRRTSYYEAGSIESLTENTWDMPFEFESGDARLYLVLRDERGGLSWAEYAFTLEETR